MYAQPQPQFYPQWNPYHRAKPRRMNPLGAGTAIGILVGVVAVSAGAYAVGKAIESRTPARTGVAPEPSEHELSGVYVPGATLLGSPKISSVLRLPIALTTWSLTDGDGAQAPTVAQFPSLSRAEHLVIRSRDGLLVPLEYITALPDGHVTFKVDEVALMKAGIAYDVTDEIMYADGTHKGALEQVGRLVTDLAGPVADTAYDAASSLILEGNRFDEPSGSRDAYVAGVLREVAPKITWPDDPSTLGVGTPRWQVWMGVSLVGQIAQQVMGPLVG